MGVERRESFRLTTPIRAGVGLVSAGQDPPLTQMTMNVSGGGIGFVTTARYDVGQLVLVILDLGDNQPFRAQARILHVRSIPGQRGVRRIGARFSDPPQQDIDRLIRWILRRQAEHLRDHYIA